ncbi:MAG: hypothetical protein MR704_04865 [Clostridia bacterium]|nr:hypothetical protein [Clostridia bacterium]
MVSYGGGANSTALLIGLHQHRKACRTTPEKKPSIRERLEDAKRECAERKGPDKPAPQKKPPELGDL